jgi:hypothetical protein
MSIQAAYRLGDGAPVGVDAARAIWAAVAREVLEAKTPTATITHSDLARQVQQRSGVYTRTSPSEWLPTVLADLGDAELVARVHTDPPRAATRARTSATRKAPAQPRPAKRQEAPPKICPTCFMQLPANGRCDTCS